MKKRRKIKIKHGQVTIFIIVAIIIFGIIFGLFLSMNNKFIPINKQINSEIVPIDNEIKDCVLQTSYDAIGLIGLQGGFANLKTNYLNTNSSKIAYGYFEGKNVFPSKEKIESEINDFVKTMLPICLNPSHFPEYNIFIYNATSKIDIEDNYILVDAKLPVSIKKGDRNYYLDHSYSEKINIRFGKIYNIAQEIVNKEITDSKNIDLSYLSSQDFFIMTMVVDNDKIIYSITDTQSIINDIPYSFLFANKFKEKI